MGLQQWPEKKIKIEGEVISEIMVADTGLESGPDASDVEDYFEEKEQQQQASAEVAIANTRQRNHQPTCTAGCVLPAAKERAQCISAPDVTWACVWCLVSRNITQK